MEMSSLEVLTYTFTIYVIYFTCIYISHIVNICASHGYNFGSSHPAYVNDACGKAWAQWKGWVWTCWHEQGLWVGVALPSQALAVPQQELVKTSEGVGTGQVPGDGDKPAGSLQGCL